MFGKGWKELHCVPFCAGRSSRNVSHERSEISGETTRAEHGRKFSYFIRSINLAEVDVEVEAAASVLRKQETARVS